MNNSISVINLKVENIKINKDIKISHLLCPALINKNRKKLSSKDYVKQIMNGEIVLPTALSSSNFNIFNETFEKDVHTSRLYQFSLFWLTPLLNEYIISKDSQLKKIINDFIDNFFIFLDNNFNRLDRIRASDHSASMRLINFINLINHFELDLQEKELIINYINHLIIFLQNSLDKIRNNHGIMIIMALLHIIPIINKDDKIYLEIINIIQKDLISLYDDIFYESGYAKENSIFYHTYNIKCFREVEDFCKELDIQINFDEIQKKLTLSENISQRIIYPDNTIPTIGDSNNGLYTKAPSINESSFFADAGFAIIKNDDIYFSIKSGMGFPSHKHMDECSITLRYKDVDIIHDCGVYNYDSRDPIRQLLVSPEGHSGIFPSSIKKMAPFTYINELYEYGGVNDFIIDQENVKVNAYLKLKNNFYANRNIIYNNIKKFIITDTFINFNDDTEIRFCLNHNSKISFTKDTINSLDININNIDIRFVFFSDDTFDIIEEEGYFSRLVGRVNKIKCLSVKFINRPHGMLKTKIIIL